MRIVIATPLYPPDLAEPAQYVKELATRLKGTHRVTVVTYAHIPEEVPGVHIISTSKQRPLPVRLLLYTLLLLRACRGGEVLYAQSGSSVGLPVMIVQFLRHTPLVVHVIEDEAWERAIEEQLTKKSLHDFLTSPEGSLKIRFIARLQGLLLRHAKRVVVSKHALLQPVIEGYHVHKSRVTVVAEPVHRPEILPFQPYPTAKLEAYNASWEKHIQALEDVLHHAE